MLDLVRSTLACGVLAAAGGVWVTPAEMPSLDAALVYRIDSYVAAHAQRSGLPGVAVAKLQAYAPVQQYLPWFRVADAPASAHVTLRHLLNQTGGFTRADGIAPLLQDSSASVKDLARGMARLLLNRPVGEAFEYGNLNFVLLGAVLQHASGRSWHDPAQERLLPIADVAALLAAASPPGQSTLMSTRFEFRHGESWFVGPFGAAADARRHLGYLPSFPAWMVLLHCTQQAVVVLINAHTELPFFAANAVISRLPIGIVNLLRVQSQTPALAGSSGTAGYEWGLAMLAVVAWRAMSLSALAATVPDLSLVLGLAWVFAWVLAWVLAFLPVLRLWWHRRLGTPQASEL